jgi:hypothetical protein
MLDRLGRLSCCQHRFAPVADGEGRGDKAVEQRVRSLRS